MLLNVLLKQAITQIRNGNRLLSCSVQHRNRLSVHIIIPFQNVVRYYESIALLISCSFFLIATNKS